MARSLSRHRKLAVDCEAAGFHRYSDRLCLVQIATLRGVFLVDPLSFDPSEALRQSFEDPSVTLIMHGGDYDLRLLDRDLGIRARNLFDTHVAAALLGEPALGLSALLERHIGVLLEKKHQRADWARRPLPGELREYAADDVRHLLALADALAVRLTEKDRTGWAEEEFRILEDTRWEPKPDHDPVTRVKGARSLDPRSTTALRATLEWRDRIARELDRAPFRVVGDKALLVAATGRPASMEELEALHGFPRGVARRWGVDLVALLQEVEERHESELVPYPADGGDSGGRPTPEILDLVNRLKEIRNRAADRLGIDRGTLLPNGLLLELARRAPLEAQELASMNGIRRWQWEVVGQDFARTLNDGHRIDSPRRRTPEA